MASSGQADVYRAWDKNENSGYYAVKIFKSENDSNDLSANTQRNAANAEIQSLEKLEDHPNILKLEDIEYREETKSVSLISRWIPGGNLLELIGRSDEERLLYCRRELEDDIFEFEEEEKTWLQNILEELKTKQSDIWLDNSDLLIGILDGLKFAHNNGIYHRDLKPANVLIDIDLETKSPMIPVLCDFGAAKIRDEYGAKGLTNHNNTLVDIRTKAYRWDFGLDTEEGQKERQYQHTWDLVSWAVIAIELLANQKVSSPGEAIQLFNKKFADNLDPEIVDLLQRAISKKPSERPQDAGEFKLQLIVLTERRKNRLNWEC